MASILIVETEPALARRIEWILDTDGYETTTVSSPTAAIDSLEERSHDLVILNSDSPQSAKRIVIERMRDTTHTTVLDVHSAAHPLETEPDTSGADGYLHMPFDAEALLEELDRLLAA